MKSKFALLFSLGLILLLSSPSSFAVGNVKTSSPEQRDLESARKLFSAGKYQDSIAAYDKISKGSDRWTEAVEEKGWAWLNLGQTDKALSQTRTLLNPPLIDIASPEVYFLQALSQMKVCDYKGVIETLKLFRTTQRARILEIQTLSKTGSSASLDKVMARVKSFPITLDQVGEDVKHLPRLFYHDVQLQNAIKEVKAGKVAANAQVQSRMKTLALQETDETFKVLKKLNLIDVEITQRIFIDQKTDKKSYAHGEFAKKTDDDLSFADDGRPWIDELDKYQYKVNGVPRQHPEENVKPQLGSSVLLTLLTASAFLLNACARPENGTIYGRRELPQAVIPKTRKPTRPGPQVFKHVEINADGPEFDFHPRLNVVFQLDDSDSMVDHLENLNRNLGRFSEAFTKKKLIDWSISVLPIGDSTPRPEKMQSTGEVYPLFIPFPNAAGVPYEAGEFVNVKDRQDVEVLTKFVTRDNLAAGMTDLRKSLHLNVRSLKKGGPEHEEFFAPLVAMENRILSNPTKEEYAAFAGDQETAFVIMTDSDESGVAAMKTRKDPVSPAAAFNQYVKNQADSLKNFKNTMSGPTENDKLAVYGVLINKMDADKDKDFDFRADKVTTENHAECFKQEKGNFVLDNKGKPVKIDDYKDKCVHLGPDFLEAFIREANEPNTMRQHIKSITKKDFGDDLAQIGSDITKRLLNKKIHLRVVPRTDESGNLVNFHVRYGTKAQLDKGGGMQIEDETMTRKPGFQYHEEDGTLTISDEMNYGESTGGQFRIDCDIADTGSGQ